MDAVSAVSGAKASSTNTTLGKTTVDYNAFLKLLVTEMKNQDPTKPMESTEYVAQLASFSNVEQSVQMNKKLDQLLSSSFIQNAGSLIGKTITSSDGQTSGEIVQVKVIKGVGTAILADGKQLAVNESVTISQTATQ